jgi:hypothetical protein
MRSGGRGMIGRTLRVAPMLQHPAAVNREADAPKQDGAAECDEGEDRASLACPVIRHEAANGARDKVLRAPRVDHALTPQRPRSRALLPGGPWTGCSILLSTRLLEPSPDRPGGGRGLVLRSRTD